MVSLLRFSSNLPGFTLLHGSILQLSGHIQGNQSYSGRVSYLSQLRVDKHDPEVMSHILMVWSQEQLTRMFGFLGSKTTPLTKRLCPLRVNKHDPEVMSHILMVMSLEQLTRMLGLSGLNTTQFTWSLLKHTKLVLKMR